MQSKIRRYFDEWFHGLGFPAISRITGIVSFNLDNIDESMTEAFAIWKSLSLSQQVKHYQEIGFEDHASFNEKEFLNTISKTL